MHCAEVAQPVLRTVGVRRNRRQENLVIKTLSSIAVGACVVGMVGCGTDDKKPAAAPELDFSAFDQAVEQLLIDESLEGATAIIVHREWGVMHEMGYGAFGTDRVSLVASSGKVASVGVLMRLQDQGLLDIDEPIGDYLTDWTGVGKTDRTVAQMVSNSAGMLGLLDNPTYTPYVCQYVNSGTLTDCAKSIYGDSDIDDLFPPDTEFHYGGGQWQLAGGIAEAVSGKTWAELIEETYVTPCGMTHTAFNNHYLTSAFTYPTAIMGDPTRLPPTDNPSIEGGMYTTVGDYGQFLLMQLRGGMCDDTRVLSESAVETMQADRIGEVYDGTTGNNPAFPGYGLGWWVSRDEPGVVQDAGAYGAVAWLDNNREYGAILILEATAVVGSSFVSGASPLVNAVFDDYAATQL